MLKALFFFLSCLSVAKAQSNSQSVVVFTVEEGQALAPYLTAVGTFTPYNDVILKAEIEGRVEKVHFKDGDKAKDAQLLVTLHNQEQQASVKKAEAVRTLSKKKFVRKKDLFQKKFGSQQSSEEAASQFQGDEADLALAKENLRKTKILSPFKGVLSSRKIAKGSYVQPGEELVRIQDISPIRLVFQLPQKEIPVIQMGQPLTATTDVYPGEVFEGHIDAIEPCVDKETRSITVYAAFDNESTRLMPGLYGQIHLPLTSKAKNKSTLSIPERSLFVRQDGTYVYRQVNGKAVLTKVTLGVRTTDQAEILSGLKKGDVVILEGQETIKDGDAITGVKST